MQELRPLKIMVTGGRNYSNVSFVEETFDEFARIHGPVATLIVGDATGLDSIAATIGRSRGWEVRVFKADWAKYKQSAGPIRNRAMVDQKPDFCLPFEGGRGTADAVRQATKAGIPLFYKENHVQGI